MDEFLSHLRYGAANLTRFSGRDGRKPFWIYAGTILAGLVAGYALQSTWLMSDMLMDPDSAMGRMKGALVATFIVATALVCLLAAAVSRRLHDTNRSALWGLTPLPFLAFGMIQMWRMLGGFGQEGDVNFDAFVLTFVNNLAYLVVLGGLVFLLASPGDETENRFGAPQGPLPIDVNADEYPES